MARLKSSNGQISHLMTIGAFGLVLLALVAKHADAEPPGFKTLAIGDPAPDFKLPGVDGKEYSLSDFSAARLLAIVYTCNHCPTAQAYETRLAELYADYKDRGVALVAISPNDPQAVRLDELGYTDLDDSFEAMKIRAQQREFKFPYLYDGETQKTSLAYGVLATPHAYLFDADRKLRYVRRIDDSEVKTVKSHDLRNAIDELLAGNPIAVEKTRVSGCSTKWSEKHADATKSLEKWDQEPVTLELLDEAGANTLAKNDTSKLLLVNLWATWCGPCVTELPELVTTYRMYRQRDLQLVTISLDETEHRDSALKVLQEKHVSGTNYLMALASRDKFADILDKDWPGPVPYTLLIAPGGKVLYRKNGEIDPLELRCAIVDFLGRTYAPRPPISVK